MSYTADISRANPGCFLFMVDQSGSMKTALGGQPGLTKMEAASQAINRILDTISQRCSQGMDVKDYFHIGIITYTTDRIGKSTIASLLPRTTLEDPFLTVSDIVEAAEVQERLVLEPDGAGGTIEVNRRFPVWLNPVASQGTPMCQAMDIAHRALRDWIDQNPNAYPPMVLNITDGDATDGNPEEFAQSVRELATTDGNVLLYNAHLSEVSASPVQYPTDGDPLPGDEYATRMFRMSSVFPDNIVNQAQAMSIPVQQGSRGYVYNADMVALVQFLDIGTRAAANLH